ncbi:unnamed protein product [Allacma fusca]|uniref:Uncharacterized protein n=1 Tax=Allacma fusca TaxID=39272 RepID=A0A8J2M8J6_9HEXA|nr:unnamed protein product [Allacma fusca]
MPNETGSLNLRSAALQNLTNRFPLESFLNHAYNFIIVVIPISAIFGFFLILNPYPLLHSYTRGSGATVRTVFASSPAILCNVRD